MNPDFRSHMNRSQLAQLIDHTLLKPEATRDDVEQLCVQARELNVFAVCVSPTFVQLAKSLLDDDVVVATVCGFPSGKHHSSIKAMEATLAVQHGADEVDMVIDVGTALAGNWDSVEADIALVRMAIPDSALKVILETAALTDEQIQKGCLVAARAGANFVKTSTGFHPSGGASIQAVQIMHATVGGQLGIKASGGIRDVDFAIALIEAGATRLGLSATENVLNGLPS